MTSPAVPPSPTPNPASRVSNALPSRALRFLRYRGQDVVNALGDRERLGGWIKHRVWHRVRRPRPPHAHRLHIGCGKERLEGWCNIDLLPFTHVDVCLDVTRGLPFEDVDLVFAEHFLEHLEVTDALDFLVASQRCLRDDGWIRLSTPNLDWVWTHLYNTDPNDQRVDKALAINRAFYCWQHCFIWNRSLLEQALLAVGFTELRWCLYGESGREAFRGIERHELYDDTPELPHVLIVEARKGTPRPEELQALRRLLADEFCICRS